MLFFASLGLFGNDAGAESRDNSYMRDQRIGSPKSRPKISNGGWRSMKLPLILGRSPISTVRPEQARAHFRFLTPLFVEMV
ncbi:hypothetical protein DC522_29855 [Microvirga sp. KLBC 81]|nr:hypothetical protein DC522_29855 [Microvirga sp. KLBC 81]